MPYKATTNVYGKRLIKSGEIITDSEYSSLSAVPRNRFVFLDPESQADPAGQTADEVNSSADQSGNVAPKKDPDIVTFNPDREYLNEQARASRKAKQQKNK